MAKYVSADEALKVVKSNDYIYVQGATATPTHLLDALARRANELSNVRIAHILTMGDEAVAHPELRESFFIDSLFFSKNMKHVLHEHNGSYTPIFLSDIPLLFDRHHIKVDVALLHVSPPDKFGYCSMGISVEAAKAAARNATYVIAQINPLMPCTYGDAMLHIDEVDYLVEYEAPIYTLPCTEPSAVEKQIGKHIAALIEDGSTLQLGIGNIPNATVAEMGHLKNLGVHTELLTEGVVELVEKGVINGSEKKVDKGKIVTSFIMGTRRLYDFVDKNPMVVANEIFYTNEVSIIRQNPKMISINSAIEVDLSGQVCADSIGTSIYSGFGGQVDFVRGAALSEGGKSIIAFSSQTSRGESKIVPFLKQGAGVVTTRAHVHYVATEYGVAELFGKNLHDRAKSLIAIAHPDHQEMLERAFYKIKSEW